MITGQKVNNTVVQSGGLGKKRKHAHPAFLCLANSHRSFWYHFDCYKLTSCCSSLLLNCSSTRAVVKYRLVCSCLHNWSKQCLGCHLQWCLSCYQLHAGSAVTLLLKYGRGRKQKSLVVFVHAFFFLRSLPARCISRSYQLFQMARLFFQVICENSHLSIGEQAHWLDLAEGESVS